jgi:hypothetical protein
VRDAVDRVEAPRRASGIVESEQRDDSVDVDQEQGFLSRAEATVPRTVGGRKRLSDDLV